MPIAFDRLVRRYDDVNVLDGLSGTIGDRALTAVLGPSGCGKSTLLAIFAGVERPTSGWVVHTDDTGMPVGHLPRRVAWVTQMSSVVPYRSALDNVMIGPLATGSSLGAAEHHARTSLEAVGIMHLGSVEARRLSGGERQRVAVARALASGLPYVFADEPTAHLDKENTAAVTAALSAVAAHRLVVVATHDPALALAADRVVELRPPTR